MKVGELTQGLPALHGDRLPPESYVEVRARKLTQPKLLWLNVDWLREHGIEVPPAITPEFEKEVLDAFGWAVPQPHDPPELFGPEEHVFYADRYGGEGLEGNWGSGRAASAGLVQIKGIGRTPLVAVDAKDHHAHGGASIIEAMSEAIWGELNDRELPYGANRAIAIIDTGTYTYWRDGGREARALIVREDPLRPAHFIAKGAAPGDVLEAHAHHRQAEATRVPAAVRLLAHSLPAVPVAEGLREFARRLGTQCASAYAHGFYHGTTSPSNRVIDGGLLDYGTQTYQHGFGQITVLEEVAPAGQDFDEYKETNDNLIDVLQAHPVEEQVLPTKEELAALSTRSYAETLRRELLYLTGMPVTIVNAVTHTPEAKAHADALLDVARCGAGRINVDKYMPDKVTRYSVRSILLQFAEAHGEGADRLFERLSCEAPYPDGCLASAEQKRQFVRKYEDFSLVARQAAADLGIRFQALKLLILENCRKRNRVLHELFRSNLQQTNFHLVESYKRSGDRWVIWDSVNQRIHRNTVTYSDVDVFEVVLSETRDPVENNLIRYSYDAKTNTESLILRTGLNTDGSASARGHRFSEGQILSSRFQLRWSRDQRILENVQPEKKTGYYEFRIPLPPEQDLELVLLGPNGETILNLDLKVFFSSQNAFRVSRPSLCPSEGAHGASSERGLGEAAHASDAPGLNFICPLPVTASQVELGL